VARFEAIRGFTPRGDIAIDDFSLTPECFGLGKHSLSVSRCVVYNKLYFVNFKNDEEPDFKRPAVVPCGCEYYLKADINILRGSVATRSLIAITLLQFYRRERE